MTRYEPGDVVLLRFPFTDLSAAKKRPAVVISPAGYPDSYGDIVVLALTSKPQDDKTLSVKYWREAGLLKTTWVKPLIGTVSRKLIERKMGSLSEKDSACVHAALRFLIAPEYID